MNNFMKKTSKKARLFTKAAFVSLLLTLPAFLTATAMDGYSDKVGIRGFELPKEQIVPASVHGTIIKEAVNIDFFKIAFIGLIALGVLILIAVALHFIKNAKRGISNEL